MVQGRHLGLDVLERVVTPAGRHIGGPAVARHLAQPHHGRGPAHGFLEVGDLKADVSDRLDHLKLLLSRAPGRGRAPHCRGTRLPGPRLYSPAWTIPRGVADG